MDFLEEALDPEMAEIGNNVREARLAKGWSMRQLATEAEVSPSLISQIENGRTTPSVRTLYSLAGALSLPVTHLVPDMKGKVEETAALETTHLDLTPSELRTLNDGVVGGGDATPKHLDDPILRRDVRPHIQLQGGISWHRLTKTAEQNIEFLQTEYPVGATSGERMSRHAGREFGLILEGELSIEIGFDTYVLQAGDSIAFDSTRPHRLTNTGSVPMRAIWVVWE
jgi:transcriptional regulator with XRE-family HTH domain